MNTSIKSYKAIKTVAATKREEVYSALQKHGPMTDEQIQEVTGMNPSTERPRRIELEEARRVVAAGVGHTKAGRKAFIWKAL
jgi:transcription initiation factor IIE alpha subunit